MDPHRINVFHVTYGNAVSLCITHYLVLDFLPASNTAFYQNLPHAA